MEAFDELDFRILREMWAGSGAYFRSDRVSYAHVAKALGIHRSTVGDRVQKWVRTGALEGFTVDVDPSAVGLVGAHVQLRTGEDQDATGAAEALATVDGVQTVLVMDEGWLGAPVFADDSEQLDGRLARLVAMTGAQEVVHVADTREDFPGATPVPFGRLDARVLGALLEGGRRLPTEIAEATGLTARTVVHRVARLQEASVFFMLPRMRAHRIRGMAVGVLSFHLPAEKRARALREVLERAPNHVLKQVEAPRRGLLFPYGESAEALEAVAEAVRGVEGVTEVRLRRIVADVAASGFTTWLQARIDRHAALSLGHVR